MPKASALVHEGKAKTSAAWAWLRNSSAVSRPVKMTLGDLEMLLRWAVSGPVPEMMMRQSLLMYFSASMSRSMPL